MSKAFVKSSMTMSIWARRQTSQGDRVLLQQAVGLAGIAGSEAVIKCRQYLVSVEIVKYVFEIICSNNLQETQVRETGL